MTERLLVVEPDAELRNLLAMILRGAGYDCDLVGFDAIDEAGDGLRQGLPPTGIVLDLPARHAEGLALSHAAKARWPGVPLLVLVSVANARFHAACLAAGAAAVVCRPFRVRAFLDAVHGLFDDEPEAPARSLRAEPVGRPAQAQTEEPSARSPARLQRPLSRVSPTRRTGEARSMPKRILVVEDEPDVAQCVQTLLEADGYDVMQAGTLGAARRWLEAPAPPHLAVLDVRLPDGDGIEFSHEVQATWPTLPVLLTSGRLSAAACADARATGCVALLPKPFDLDTLDLVIRIAVGDVPDRRGRPRMHTPYGSRHAS